MKIFLLAAANDIHTVRWVNKLIENGNEVHLAFCSNHKPYMDKYDKKVVLHKLRFSSPMGYYLNSFELKNILKKVKPDVLNVHYASGYGTLGRLVKYKPYLISVYGSDVYDFPYKSKQNMKIIKKNLLAADKIASTSKAMARQVNKIVDYPIEKIYITPFGVDINKFKKLNENNSKLFVIGSIKKLEAKYGIRYGILAVDYFINNLIEPSKRNNIKYYIYGEGNEESELKQLVKEKGLLDIVEFKGRISNDKVPIALNDMNVLLGTSILDSESFGVAIVEAMACEVPVVVTDVDGFKEVVDVGNAGILVKKKDYKQMAQQIKKLYIDSNFSEKLAKIERKRVVDFYSWSLNVKNMEAIYKKLVEENNRGILSK